MTTIVLDHLASEELIRERQEKGLDRNDEVWDGVYMIMPLPNPEHQVIGTGLASVLTRVITWAGLGQAFNGVNVSDRNEGWTENYRCPDEAVYLKGNPARQRSAHMQGGPDFAVEIISPDDRSHEKLDFYAKVGTREVLIIDREPWRLELYRLKEGELGLVGVADLTNAEAVTSEVVPLRFRLVEAPERPQIEITHVDGQPRWLV